ncbi:MAG: fibrobacter succinogenes major paralogous domain-containing protein [Bacteroidales bacterium]|nr:fibrobacter succinogenes major paralogous domain-containing protein [Bacteroidales bacterium]
MKKIINTFAAFAVAFTMVSCDKENATSETSRMAVIFASTENGITRTALDGNDTDGYDVVWSADDSFVIGNKTFTLTEGEDATSGKFEGVIPDDGNYTVYYPSIYNGTDWPASQPYAEGNIAGSPMKASVKVADGNLPASIQFKNVGGILRLTVKNADEQILTRIVVCADGLEPITLDCNGGVKLTEEGVVFHIAMPEGEYDNVRISLKSGALICRKKLSSSTKLVINRSKITTASFTARDFALPDGAVPLIFSVGDNKRVMLACGNLWCDTAENPGPENFHFETNSLDTPGSGTRNESHISHFMWSGTLQGAVALEYDGNVAEKGVFSGYFTVDDCDLWRLPTNEEWKYLYNISKSDGPRKGKHSGLRLYADDSDTDYVELPAAGYRNHYKSEDIISSGAYGMYWSSSSYGNDNADAYALHYYLGAVNTEWYNKNMAFSVRLVMDVDDIK